MASVTDGTRAVLVTGAAQGIGEATVRRLAARGFRVYAGVRSQEDEQRLVGAPGTGIIPVRLDVRNPSSIDAAVAALAVDGPFRFLGLVNNAAVSTPCPLELLPSDELRALFDVNVFGTVALTRRLLPHLRSATRGHIVNVSSINGRLAQPFIGGYSATKFAMEAVSDTLRRELRPWRIAVTVVQPGAVATSIFRTARARGRALAARIPHEQRNLYPDVMRALLERPGHPPRHAIPPDRVAKVIVRALTQRRVRTRYRVGLDAWFGTLVAAALPDRLLDRILTWTR